MWVFSYSSRRMAHFVYPVANAAQPATAYPTAQTAYVAAAPQAAYATAAPRAAQAYESYQAAHAAPQYAYTTRTQVAVTVSIANNIVETIVRVQSYDRVTSNLCFL